jgi:uncharacterized protein YcbX
MSKVNEQLIERQNQKNVTSMLHDEGSFMILSEKSLEDLNEKLEKKVSVRNFRPNFVIKDALKPYGEVVFIICYLFLVNN